MAKRVALVAWCGCYVAEPEGSFPRRLKPCGQHGTSFVPLRAALRDLDRMADLAASVLDAAMPAERRLEAGQELASRVLLLRDGLRVTAAEDAA